MNDLKEEWTKSVHERYKEAVENGDIEPRTEANVSEGDIVEKQKMGLLVRNPLGRVKAVYGGTAIVETEDGRTKYWRLKEIELYAESEANIGELINEFDNKDKTNPEYDPNSIEDLYMVGEVKAEKLREAGYSSVEELRGISKEELMNVDKIGPALAGTLSNILDPDFESGF